MTVWEEQQQPEPQAQAKHRRPWGKPRRRSAAGQHRPATQQRRQGILGRAGTEQHQQSGGTQQPADTVVRPPTDDHGANHRPGKKGRVDHDVDDIEDRDSGKGSVGAAEAYAHRPQTNRQCQHCPNGPGSPRSRPVGGGTHSGQRHQELLGSDGRFPGRADRSDLLPFLFGESGLASVGSPLTVPRTLRSRSQGPKHRSSDKAPSTGNPTQRRATTAASLGFDGGVRRGTAGSEPSAPFNSYVWRNWRAITTLSIWFVPS